MAKEHILVVEDENDIQELVEYNLIKNGYQVTCVATGEDSLDNTRSLLPDLVILDLMLPGLDGLQVCRILKNDSNTQKIPIIMLTAKGEESDIVKGLEYGADDYVTKPFSPKVLVARVKAVLRRQHDDPVGEDSVIKVLEIEIHPRAASSFHRWKRSRVNLYGIRPAFPVGAAAGMGLYSQPNYRSRAR